MHAWNRPQLPKASPLPAKVTVSSRFSDAGTLSFSLSITSEQTWLIRARRSAGAAARAIFRLAPARSVDLMTRMTTPEPAHAARAALAKRKPAGVAGAEIPPVALGCGNFGGVGSAPEFFGGGLTDDQAFELMDAAWE